MVGWSPELEVHEPLAPEGPPSDPAAPAGSIIRRGVRSSASGAPPGTPLASPPPRDAASPRTAATLAAHDAARRFDENRPMPGETLAANERASVRFYDVAEEPDETRRNAPPVETRGGDANDGTADALREAETTETMMMETKTGSRLRRVVGRMRTDLAAASAARDAHLDRVRRFLAGPGESAPFPEDAAAPVPVPDDEDAAEPPRAVRETERDRRVLEPFAEAREDPEKIPPARLGMAREESPSRGSAVAGTSTDPDGDPLGAALGLPASPERFAASAAARSKPSTTSDAPRRSLREASSSDGASGLDRRGANASNASTSSASTSSASSVAPPRQTLRLREQWEAFILSKMRRVEEATLTRVADERAAAELAAYREAALREHERREREAEAISAARAAEETARIEARIRAELDAEAERKEAARALETRLAEERRSRDARVEALAAEARAVRRSDSRRALESLAAQSAMEARLDRDSGASLRGATLDRDSGAALRIVQPALAARVEPGPDEAEVADAEAQVEEVGTREARVVAETREAEVGPREAETREAEVVPREAGPREAEVGTREAETREAEVGTREAETREAQVGTREAETREAQVGTREAEVGTREAEPREAQVGTREAEPREAQVGTREAEPGAAEPGIGGVRDFFFADESVTAARRSSASSPPGSPPRVAEATAVADAAEALARASSGLRASTASGVPAFPSTLRLQLLAVGVLAEAQRAKHARRLAELRAAYDETRARLDAEEYLLAFAPARRDARRAARETNRKRIGTRGGGGVFFSAGSRNPGSHNANVRANRSNPPARLFAGASPEDPWAGSAFARDTLVALTEKRLAKLVLGVFAARAALARGRRAYIRRVCEVRGAPAARSALRALRGVARASRERDERAAAFKKASDVKRARASVEAWKEATRAAALERERSRLAVRFRARVLKKAAHAQWRALPAAAERAAHCASLASSFARSRASSAALHAWAVASRSARLAKARVLARTPDRAEARRAAEARLRDAESNPNLPSVAEAKRRAAAGRRAFAELAGSARRAAARDADATLERLGRGRFRFYASESDVTWIALANQPTLANETRKDRNRTDSSSGEKTEPNAEVNAEAEASAEAEVDGGPATSASAEVDGGPATSASASALALARDGALRAAALESERRAALEAAVYERPPGASPRLAGPSGLPDALRSSSPPGSPPALPS